VCSTRATVCNGILVRPVLSRVPTSHVSSLDLAFVPRFSSRPQVHLHGMAPNVGRPASRASPSPLTILPVQVRVGCRFARLLILTARCVLSLRGATSFHSEARCDAAEDDLGWQWYRWQAQVPFKVGMVVRYEQGRHPTSDIRMIVVDTLWRLGRSTFFIDGLGIVREESDVNGDSRPASG
jgi:hypothetical protein